MIKHQHVALREASKNNGSIIKMRFANERGENDEIVVNVEQDIPLSMSNIRPTAMLTGIYVPGRMARNPFDHREMKKDWFVIRSHARPDEVVLDPWPPTGVPIIVQQEGIADPKIGVVVNHIRTLGDGKETTDLVFVEMVFDQDHVTVPVAIEVQAPSGEIMSTMFQPHDMNGVLAWAYLSVGNQLIPPHRDAMLELFVDCEFEDSTNTLLSLSLVTRDGRIYYAFDSEAADKVQEEWVQNNVLPVLLDVPPSTTVFDLARARAESSRIQTFQNFVATVIAQNTNNAWLDPELVIHADFPTDIGYLAPLFHLGGGERLRPMSQIRFIVDYVDSYPTGLKAAVQHNAAWDALAMWLHMGYTAYLDPRSMANSSIRNKAHEMKAPDDRDYFNAWTSGMKGILEKDPGK